jgi:protease-4
MILKAVIMKDFFKNVLASSLGVVIAFGAVFMFGIVMAVAVLSSGESSELKENSVLFLDLDAELVERAEDNTLTTVFGDKFKSFGLDEVVASVKEAKDNVNIKGIYLQAGAMSASAASLEELRRELESFKEGGKFVVAYGDQYSQELYYLASVADKVIVNPKGSISWHGLVAQPVFYKNLLEKLGVKMQIFKVGTYKSAVEPFIATEMSDANREQVMEFMNDTWNGIAGAVSASRNIPMDRLNALADRYMGFRQAEEYVECGLADTLLYKDGVLDYLKSLTGTKPDEKLNMATLEDVSAVVKRKKLQEGLKADKIAVYYAFGGIDDAMSTDEGINSEKVIKELRELREDKNVKAVVLRVNSPGGSAYGSEQIWREMVLLKAAKPVVVSMGDYAASGGYYISCAADCIVANSMTLTGSIGIFGMFPVAEELLKEKVGLAFDVVKTNRFSDLGSMARPFNKEEKEIMQQYINDGYSLFVQRCADGRGMSVEDICRIAEGRVWTGSRAKEVGLVDEIGGIDKALEIAAQKAGLKEYAVYECPAVENFMEALAGKDKDDYLESMAKGVLGDFYYDANFIRNIRNCDPVQARLPFELNIR